VDTAPLVERGHVRDRTGCAWRRSRLFVVFHAVPSDCRLRE
jgi:hypothetical protein